MAVLPPGPDQSIRIPGRPLARRVIAIASGKGGVGKSTIALNLSVALAQGEHRVGLLDADFYAPDIPLMVGLKRSKRQERWELWRHPTRPQYIIPPVERFGVKIASVGFHLSEDQALLQPFDIARFVLYQLVDGVAWGPLDYLVVDLPPGTSDLQQELIRVTPVSGALIIVNPQDVAHLDAQRAIEMFEVAGVRILGGIENMSSFVCPHCKHNLEVFPRVRHDRSIWSKGVRCLGRLPYDEAVALAGNHGRPVADASEGDSGALFRELAATVITELEDAGGRKRRRPDGT